MSTLQTTEAVTLLPSIILTLAERHGVRALLIKGQTLSDQGLRSPRQSSDVDVWIEPGLFEAFRRVLADVGWVDRDEKKLAPLSGPPSVFVVHSVTLMNKDWPVSVDLHRCYPGFFAPPRELFDRVWEAREANVVGHQLCVVPQRIDHWLLAMLHTLRDGNQRQISDLEAAANGFTRDELASVGRRALLLGAVEPLRDRLEARGLRFPQADREASRLLREWHLTISDDAHGDFSHVNELLRARGWARLTVIRKALFPPETTYRLFHEVGPGRRGLLLAYARRWGSGFMAVPRMTRYAFLMKRRPGGTASTSDQAGDPHSVQEARDV